MIMMTLKRFRVTNFRSIMDSGWIECDDVTSLVGVNEAGKSNVILALWKLKPVRDGGIDALHDMPTKKYAAWRASPEKITFISADFELDGTLVDKVAKLCDCDRAAVSVVNIKRRYDGKYVVSFPNYQKATDIKSSSVAGTVLDARDQLMLLSEKTKAETGIKEKVMNLYDEILSLLEGKEFLSLSDYETITELYPSNLVKSATSEIYPHYTATKNTIEKAFQILHTINPTDNADARELMIAEMPSFVYYSNYGNLDAQIYLPHAIKWLKGEKVDGISNEAKVRTLRVLFDFVKLDPEEVLELGKDPIRIVEDRYGNEVEKKPTKEEIAAATEQKAARAILLNSASSELTSKFKQRWTRGYKRYKETSGLIEWKECQIFHSIFT